MNSLRLFQHGPRHQTLGLISRGLALIALLSLTIMGRALEIDEFDPPGWEWVEDYGLAPLCQVETVDGYLVIRNKQTLPAYAGEQSNAVSVVYDGVLPNLPLLEGRTLELQLREFTSSHDDLFGWMNYGDIGPWSGQRPNAYVLAVDRNEVVLLKTSPQMWLFFESMPETTAPVDVSMALTRYGGTVTIRSQVSLSEDPSVILFEKVFVDGPGVDANLMTPAGPHGVPSMADQGPAVPGSYGYWSELGLANYSATELAPGESIRVGGFHYFLYPAAPDPAIEPAVRIDFVRTPSPRIVLSAPELNGPWTPCAEPLYPDGDRYAMAVPMASSHQFFKTAPGVTVEDGFDGGLGSDWAVLAAPGMEEAFRLETVELEVPGETRLRLSGTQAGGPDSRLTLLHQGPAMGDFAVCLDVQESTMQADTATGLIARSVGEDGRNGYVAGVTWGPVSGGGCLPGKLWIRKIVDGVPQTLAERCPEKVVLTPGLDRRLRFTGAGDRLTVELVLPDRPDITVEPLTIHDATFTQGTTGISVTLPTETCKVTVDNFRTVGTLPE
ncbi:MAG: hypothetical protein H7A46_26440 [Verrucomicrobiales bacterium]|nr:hypothetical protein [Verrucomicrobiales bacterium]